jgi:hypothetical protein
MPNDSLSTIAGPAGVGAICILGVFLLLDGRSPNIFPTVEGYAKSTTWGVIAAIPVLVMAYVIGLFLNSMAVLAVQTVFQVSTTAELVDMVCMGSTSVDKSPAVQYFLQLRQDRAVLAGSSSAFIALSAGAFSEISNLQHIRSGVIFLASGTLLLAALLFWLAGAKTLESHQLAVTATPDAAGALRPTTGL